MVNQLNDEINGKNIKEEGLKKENNQLHKLVNKFHESKHVNKISVACQTEQVGITMI